jgi:hypothetical protein
MKTTRMLNGLVIVVGFWEALAPYTLGYSRTTVATWNAIIIGEVLVALAVVASILDYIGVYQTLDWVNAGFGLWLVLALFILSYSATVGMWNDIILGLVIIALATWAALASANPVIMIGARFFFQTSVATAEEHDGDQRSRSGEDRSSTQGMGY